MKILLGLTGSVATTLAPKIVAAMEAVPACRDVTVVMTEKAQMFCNAGVLSRKAAGVKVYTEQEEWQWETTKVSPGPSNNPIPKGVGGFDMYDEVPASPKGTVETYLTSNWQKGLPILHIELAKHSSCLVIAPATMNTIAKMANGITDNLLTSVFSAWIPSRPIIVAPSMNTRMWNSRQNQRNLQTLEDMGVEIVMPVEKELACGDTGMGAMEHASVIANRVAEMLRWSFPLPHVELPAVPATCPGIPVGKHPGSFAAIRKHDVHCGVDLYCNPGTPVSAVESGTVVSIEDFTGNAAGCSWWLDTKAVKIEGPSGVVCYGEIVPAPYVKVGMFVHQGEIIGEVTPVLRPEKLRKDIPGHSCSMLHLQVYDHGTLHGHACGDKEVPENVIDPTPFLVGSDCRPPQELDLP